MFPPPLPGLPPTCPVEWASCPVRPWSTQASVEVYALLACVALLAVSLHRAWLQRHSLRGAALALLIVAGCAVIAIVGDRWLLQYDPTLPFGDIHYTPAYATYLRKLYDGRMATAATPFILAAAAFVVGVCVTAGSLIHAARPASPERMS